MCTKTTHWLSEISESLNEIGQKNKEVTAFQNTYMNTRGR